MEINIYTEFNKNLEKLWSEFEDNALITPFQSYVWLSHWQQTIGTPLLSIQPQIVHISENGQTVLIFPLGIRKSYGIKILEWLGGQQTDYMLPLLYPNNYYNKTNFDEIWNKTIKCLQNFDVLHIKNQMEYIEEFPNPFHLKFKIHKHEISYYTDLGHSWEEFYKSKISKKLIADSRRQLRRLNEVGRVNFIVAKDTITKNNIIQKMMDQKSRRFRETGYMDLFHISQFRDFYEKLTEIPLCSLDIHCSALTVDNVMIATHLGIIHNGTYYYLMPGYEGGDWMKYSAGRLLMEYLLEWSIKNGLKVFDFTIGSEPYKMKWCEKQIDLYESVIPYSIKGSIYYLLFLGKVNFRQYPKLKNILITIREWVKIKIIQGNVIKR